MKEREWEKKRGKREWKRERGGGEGGGGGVMGAWQQGVPKDFLFLELYKTYIRNLINRVIIEVPGKGG